ncbi:recombinase family protein [Hymenobacter cellulosilyticus]|uniref:Recombinase family protein n=1 Tax=Hymenobacter cellulosilyticus TaxID=2932248 RepID=A0A8T9QDW8_9BACT|nr:recombinase family protein [Hymenobacter cellulosilyticus]UOQ75092.1 recombinase family protein [Hymenobacter cellulosilyticus]
MKAAIYARVSTRDKGQDNENQLRELRAFADRKGYSIYKEYTDQESGGKADRPEFKQLFLDAHQRRFDVVIFWALDRFSREGVVETLNHLQKLSAAGVQFLSFTEQYLDSTGVFKDAIIGILATVAKQERVRQGERSKAGQHRAREKGKLIGRPTVDIEKVVDVKRLKATGMSDRAVSRELCLSPSTVAKYLALTPSSNQ